MQLAKLCHKFESELKAKEQELSNTKKASKSLKAAFHEYQAMFVSTDKSL